MTDDRMALVELIEQGALLPLEMGGLPPDVNSWLGQSARNRTALRLVHAQSHL